jgi:CelD/BcsL family acetyltransferase involved in cellulose biosynthesis
MDMAPDPALKAMAARSIPASGQAERWADLAADAAEANCFYTPEMLIPALAHLDERGEVRLLEAYEDGTLIGLLPIVTTPRYGRLPLRVSVNWMHRHCFFGAPLIRKGFEQAAWIDFFDQLDRSPDSGHFLHLSGLDAAGANAAALEAICTTQRRPMVAIQRYDRAFLRSDLDAETYWQTNVRAKKRKEIRRLQKRLAEMGRLESRTLADAVELSTWCTDFLALEASGWKGSEGTALQCNAGETAFMIDAMAAAFAAGHLHFLRQDLDGRAIAMLANFRHGVGSFSFKIAFDEALGRFSPGVLIEIDNLHAVQSDPTVDWMDSCASTDHPMIDSLWAERRSIAQYRIALRGDGFVRLRRKVAFAAADMVEQATTLARNHLRSEKVKPQ